MACLRSWADRRCDDFTQLYGLRADSVAAVMARLARPCKPQLAAVLHPQPVLRKWRHHGGSIGHGRGNRRRHPSDDMSGHLFGGVSSLSAACVGMRARSSSDGLTGEYKTVMLAEQELWSEQLAQYVAFAGHRGAGSPAWDHEAAGACDQALQRACLLSRRRLRSRSKTGSAPPLQLRSGRRSGRGAQSGMPLVNTW